MKIRKIMKTVVLMIVELLVIPIAIISTVFLLGFGSDLVSWLIKAFRIKQVLKAEKREELDKAPLQKTEALIEVEPVIPRVIYNHPKATPTQTFEQWEKSIPSRTVTLTREMILAVAREVGYGYVNQLCQEQSWKYPSVWSDCGSFSYEECIGSSRGGWNKSPRYTLFRREEEKSSFSSLRDHPAEEIVAIALNRAIRDQLEGHLRVIEYPPEPVVKMPIPQWVGLSGNPYEASIFSERVFRSEAIRLAEEFSKDLEKTLATV